MEIYAIFARKEEVRKEFCGKYQIPVGYDSYEKLLSDSRVDVIYVALPNNLPSQYRTQNHHSKIKSYLHIGILS